MIIAPHWNLKDYMHLLSKDDKKPRAHRSGRLCVLLQLMLHVNHRFRCWPSTETLMRNTGLNKASIVEARQWLLEHRAIALVPYNKRDGKEAELPKRQNVYQLTGVIALQSKIVPYMLMSPEQFEAIKAELEAIGVKGSDLELSKTELSESEPKGSTNSEVSTNQERATPTELPLSPGKIVDFPAGDADIPPEVYRGLGMPGLATVAAKKQAAQRQQGQRENLYTHPIWQAFRNEWPEDSRPMVANAARYLEVLEQLIANGVTPERVAALARKRIAAGKTGYSFLFVPNDIHEIPASAAKPKGIWSQSAPDTTRKSNLTAEERAELVKHGKEDLARARREAHDEQQKRAV